MGEYATCKNGHYYDPMLYDSCPTCAAEAAERRKAASAFSSGDDSGPLMDDFGATEPAGGFGTSSFGGGYSSVEDYGKTEPVNMGSASSAGGVYFGGGDSDPTQPVNSGFTDSFETGEYDSWNQNSTPGRMDDMGVTEPVYQGKIHGFTPIVGWLVAIEGPARGTDYRIRPGYNFIGRDEHMDICIKGDMNISRSKAAVIGYEPEEHLFLFGPSEGKSFVKVNGKAVLGQTEIKDRDIIRVGSTKLLFVPLCDERFSWDA